MRVALLFSDKGVLRRAEAAGPSRVLQILATEEEAVRDPLFASTQLATDDEREQLKAALETDTGLITGGAIIEWLRVRGQEASSSAVSSHRRKTCTCADAE